MERGRHGSEAGPEGQPGPSTQSHTTSSTSSKEADPAGTHTHSRLQFGGTDVNALKARVPSTIPCHSINGTFRGTFHLHEYLKSSSSSSYSRLRACVSQDGVQGRITPREAEMRAGKGSRKSWKLTLMTTHAGQEMSLQKYFMLLGVEKPGQAEQQQPAAQEPPAQDLAASRHAWGPPADSGWGEEPNSKRQHLQAPGPSRRSMEESGMWLASSPFTLARTSNQEGAYLAARTSASGQAPLESQDLMGQRHSLQMSYPLSRAGLSMSMGMNAPSVQPGTTLLASLAATNMAPAPAPGDNMEALLCRIELARRLSSSSNPMTGQLQPLQNSSSITLSAHELDRWSQSSLLGSGGQLLQAQARPMLASPPYLPSTSMGHQFMPLTPQPLTYVLQQGASLANLGQPTLTSIPRPTLSHNSAGLLHLPTSLAAQQPFERLQEPSLAYDTRLSDSGLRLLEASPRPGLGLGHNPSFGRRFESGPAFFSDPGVNQRLSDSGVPSRWSLSGHGPRLGESPAALPGPALGAGPSTSTATPDAPSTTLTLPDRPDLSQVPATIPIFTQNKEVSGTLHLHDYIVSTISRPNRPPACVGLPGSDTLVTPRVAEAKAGREARKNWKESFRTTLPDGRVLSLKAYFAMHNIN